MKQLQTTGIVLARVDYGEADRILTVLTPDQGKLRLLAKGVRRIKSKLAGGIELFSISDITFLPGRREIGTLISTRLVRHYGHIVENIDRTMLGYELLKRLNKAVEDAPEAEYFQLLEQTFEALDDASIDAPLIDLWFHAQLLKLGGHTPNLTHDTSGQKLLAEQRYDFSFDDGAFTARPEGHYQADSIKFLRLVFSGNTPRVLVKIKEAPEQVRHNQQLVRSMAQQYIRFLDIKPL